MAEEGQVLGVHSVESWKEHLQKGTESKKLIPNMAEEGQVLGVHSVESWKEYLQKGTESKKLIVVDFTATWCGPCRFMAPILAEIAKNTPEVIFLKVDVDELKTVAEEWNVDAMPTFLFLKEGKEVDRVVGASKDTLLATVTKHASA